MIYKTNSGYGVNFNQLIQNGNFVNDSGWFSVQGTKSISNNEAILTPRSSASYPGIGRTIGTTISGHKYLVFLQFKGENKLALNCGGLNAQIVSGLDIANYNNVGYIFTSTASNTNFVLFVLNGRNSQYYKNVCLFDLTQMFGSGNEPTTVAEFREMYPDDYYDYTLSQWQWAKKGKITSYPTPVIENGTTLLPIEHHIVGLAHYNDGNTDIIYNYAKRELPVGFVRLDYIESTGTQLIDTGLTSFCDFEIMSQVSEGQPNKTFGNYLACLERRNAANPYWQLLFSQGETVYSSVSVYNKTKNSLRNGVWKVNDETVATLDFDYYRGNFAYLFAVDTATFYPQKIFYLKTWDKQGNMTRNFIPCYRYSDGIEGLYDTVGKQFYTNQGTGRFIRGNIIDGGILNNGN